MNSLMNVILRQGLHDQALHRRAVRCRRASRRGDTALQDKYRPENPEKVRACRRRRSQGRPAARQPNKTSILFEKGVIWSGTQNDAVISSYANLALLLGSVGRPGQVFGRQGGHQTAYIYDFDWPHPQAGEIAGTCGRSCRRARSTCSWSIGNPIRMQQQSTQLRQFVERVPFVVDMNIRPSDITEVADVVLPGGRVGRVHRTRARTSSGACGSTSSSTTRRRGAGRVPDLRRDRASGWPQGTESSTPTSGSSPAGKTCSTAMRRPRRASVGIDK